VLEIRKQALQRRRRGQRRPAAPGAPQHEPRLQPRAHAAQRHQPAHLRARGAYFPPPRRLVGDRVRLVVRVRRGRDRWVPLTVMPLAERERAADQLPMAAHRPVGADLVPGPAEVILGLLVALLHPHPPPVPPHHPRRGGGRRLSMIVGYGSPDLLLRRGEARPTRPPAGYARLLG